MKLALVALPFALLWGYAFFVEPNWFEVTRYEVPAPVERPIKIAHLTDLHINRFTGRERMIQQLLAQEKPDAIVITGDYVSSGEAWDAIMEFLKGIKAPLGVWGVKGNWEHWRPAPALDVPFERTGAKLLDNASAQLSGKLWLVGLDDFYEGRPDLDAALKGVPKDAFKLALFHSPKYFLTAAPRISLALSGHTHGGQVRIPGIKPVYLPPRSRPYVAGWYEKDGARMYVSRGLGNSILDARLFCRPELPMITLVPAKP